MSGLLYVGFSKGLVPVVNGFVRFARVALGRHGLPVCSSVSLRIEARV